MGVGAGAGAKRAASTREERTIRLDPLEERADARRDAGLRLPAELALQAPDVGYEHRLITRSRGGTGALDRAAEPLLDIAQKLDQTELILRPAADVVRLAGDDI